MEMLVAVAGCNSIINIDLTLFETVQTLLDLTLCEGESIIVDEVIYDQINSSGQIALVSENGCDLIVTISTSYEPLDNGVSVANATIVAGLFGSDYQWVDCGNNNAPIMGATDQSFTAEVSGNYAVMITQSGCTVMSECNMIIVVGTEEELIFMA